MAATSRVVKGVSIPIPRRDEDVRALLGELEDNQATVEETDIKELEAEIDEVVYDLFELTDEEREVIEDYLEVF
jgi:DNA-directed RNA polymerase sigma subunit (sigma70/sigma32)